MKSAAILKAEVSAVCVVAQICLDRNQSQMLWQGIDQWRVGSEIPSTLSRAVYQIKI